MLGHFMKQELRERFGRHPHGRGPFDIEEPRERIDAMLDDPFEGQAGPREHHEPHEPHGDRHDWFAGPRGMFGGPRGPHGGPFGGPHGPFGGPPHRGGRGGRLFTHGGLRWIILAMIDEKPRHGYEIIKEIEDKVGGAYTPSAGVVYPTLTLLEETGLVEVVSSDGNKKLYGATEAGRAALAANRAEVDDNLARMNAAQERSAGDRDPRLVRAVENLRLALHLKLGARRLSDGEVAALAALLDETAKRIETL
jgi:DNA-binding PadR family transcriptional regulator